MFNISTKEELVARAKAQSDLAPEAYRSIVELYYFARYFVSLYEARYHQLPIQVWNEYRNSLDHFVRHLTKSGLPPESERENCRIDGHLRLMKGHIQRAALDILKFNCHETDRWFLRQANSDEENVLSGVNDGMFLRTFYELHKSAQEAFFRAKAEDSSLGENAKYNKEVISRYVDAAFKYEALRDHYENNLGNIAEARHRHEMIAQASANLSFGSSVKASLTANLIWATGSAIVGLAIGLYIAGG